MKKIRLFGLLATVMVLAFGLAFFGCSSDSDNDDGGGSTIGETLRFDGNDSQGRDLTIIFYEVVATARNYEPKSGDRYEILLAGELVSSGRITKTNNVVTFISDDEEIFYGTLYGSAALSVGSIPSSEGTIAGFTSETTTSQSLPRISYSVTQVGGAVGAGFGTTAITFVFEDPFAYLTNGDITLTNEDGRATKLTAANSLVQVGTDNKTWRLSIDTTGSGWIRVNINNPWIEVGNKRLFVYADAALTINDYTPTTNGTADLIDTTQITFTLGTADPDLRVEHIRITPADVVTIGTLNRATAVYTLSVTPLKKGTISFSIDKPAHASGTPARVNPKVTELDIHKSDGARTLSYEVTQVGGNLAITNAQRTLSLRFEFAENIPAALTGSNYIITNDTGIVNLANATFTPTSSGYTATNIHNVVFGTDAAEGVLTGGDIKVQVNIAGYDPSVKTVRVLRPIYGGITAIRMAAGTGAHDGVRITFTAPVNLTWDNLTTLTIGAGGTTAFDDDTALISHHNNRVWDVPLKNVSAHTLAFTIVAIGVRGAHAPTNVTTATGGIDQTAAPPAP